jgi:predicted transcriptional regulator
VADTSDWWLWNAECQAFDGVRLRRAIVARGWTAPEFARAAKLNVQSIYNALSGKAVRDGTAIRIFEALEKRQPMASALGGG